MATKQRIVYGATTEWSGDGGTTYTNIPEVKGLVVPETEIEYQDATNLDSVGGFREFIPGLKDAGEVTIPAGYTSDGYETAVGYQTAGTLVNFRTTLPVETGQATGDTFEFTGYISPALETNDVGDIIAMNLNIRTSGAVTFTKGTAA
ncbi:hypothetical protein J7354_01555 [Sulfitobacter sp. R18_2]|uniref:phage tail tube protein n=1 Tax=Sulfitobacter sp. R18_2 TaxID=2821105 RepID=UPI001ADD3460|nr:phage tail tube protein [Sulfitobacter sp. R18_2]MBO9437336.1 hypothetical protein [Sulfitobacter sp. R18_2]